MKVCKSVVYTVSLGGRTMRNENTANVYTIILCAVCVVIAVIFFVNQSVPAGLIFLAVAALLAVVAIISIKHEQSERQLREQKNRDRKDIAGEDHEE